MPPTGPAMPRVSRETRLLLITALVSLIALWVLARVRFPERAVSPNPLPPVLTQLAPRAPFEEIPALLSELTPRLAAFLVPVSVHGLPAADSAGATRGRPAFRVRDQYAVMLLDADLARAGGVRIAARDRATGMTLIEVAPQAAPDAPVWSPRRVDYPRYLLAADVLEDLVSVRPVFVGTLLSTPSAAWGDAIWLAPVHTDLAAGTFTFTTDGALAGLAITHEGRPAVVPGQTVLRIADRLIREGAAPAGRLGIHVQALTPAIASATGAARGVVVTRVDPGTPAAAALEATDVIEAVAGRPVTSHDDWRARVALLAPGDSILLRVRRAGEVHAVNVAALPADMPGSDLPHGLTLRALNGVGVEVLQVAPGSAAAIGGLEAGDIITLFDSVRAPTAAQVLRAYAAAPGDRPMLVAITRGQASYVLTMNRQR